MRLFAILLALLISSCASIPLSTIARFSTFNAQTIAGIDPSQIRVRVAVPIGYEINTAKSQLTISLESKAGAIIDRALELRSLGMTKSKRSAGWFSKDIPVNSYDFALTSKGSQSLAQLQRFSLAEEMKNFNFRVGSQFASIPANARSVYIWADIKLADSDPYIKLIDAGKIEFDQKRG